MIDEMRGSTRDQMYEQLGRIVAELETLSEESKRLGFHSELHYELRDIAHHLGYARKDLVYLEDR